MSYEEGCRCIGKGFAVALILLAAYSVTFAQSSQVDGGSGVSRQQASNPAPALQQRYPRYRVAPSDVLSVSFPLSPELNFSPTVQPDGFIAVPNVGSIHVQGETVAEIVDALKIAYAKVLHDPIIAVDVTNFQPPEFTVSGQVGKPGQYPLRIDTTVNEGIAVAGGFLPTAKTQVFLFRRVSSEWVEVKKLNLRHVLHGKDLDEDVHLQPGDMVFVPETLIANFRKYIPYSTGMFVNPQTLF